MEKERSFPYPNPNDPLTKLLESTRDGDRTDWDHLFDFPSVKNPPPADPDKEKEKNE
jgi:hypothetical protein